MRIAEGHIVLNNGAKVDLHGLWVDLERSLFVYGVAVIVTGDTSPNNVYAYAEDGELLWKIGESRDRRGYFAVLLENERVIAYSQIGARYEVNMNDGSVKFLEAYK